jgi:hypothetical protein
MTSNQTDSTAARRLAPLVEGLTGAYLLFATIGLMNVHHRSGGTSVNNVGLSMGLVCAVLFAVVVLFAGRGWVLSRGFRLRWLFFVCMALLVVPLVVELGRSLANYFEAIAAR